MDGQTDVINSYRTKDRAENPQRCPHCGELLEPEERDEPIRWYIADDRPHAWVSPLGAKLLDCLRTNGQAVFVREENEEGRPRLRRIGIASAPNGDRIPTEDREPILITEAEYRRNWRQAGATYPGRPARTRAAGGAR